MCTYWQTINTETIDGFDIVLSVAPEECSPHGYFDDDGETAQAIADGRYEWFIARVEAIREGIVLATETIGACCYANVRDFLNESDYYGDMRAQAIAEARATIAKLAQA